METRFGLRRKTSKTVVPGLKLLSTCTAVLVGLLQAHGANLPDPGKQPSDDNLLGMLSSLEIENGTLTLVTRDESPQFKDLVGKVHENLPPRTVLKLVLTPEAGSHIAVELWLPDTDNWNSRFLGIGNGGAAGNINPGVLAGPLADGYAVATTDMGTSPGPDSGIANPAVWKDFGYRATHLMTVVSKQVIHAYYGKGPKYSYFNGRSTGGQQGIQEAQMYPEDYDGIVAGVPAHCRTPLHAYFLWNHKILSRCPFTESQQSSVIAAANEYMATREIPLIAGKFISDPRCDDEDIEGIIKLARQKDPSLTDKHAGALQKLFEGPRHLITGDQIFNGIPPGSSFNGADENLYLFRWVFGPERDLETVDFGDDYDTYSAALCPYLNAENADLSAFAERGGKLVMTAGTADPVVPYHASQLYYERVIDHFEDIEKVQEFFQFYIVPGMSHNGGRGFNTLPDLLGVVRQWREEGVVPEKLLGRRVVEGETMLEMPIYPYPLKTGWDAATSSFKPMEGARGGVPDIIISFCEGGAHL